MTREQAVAESAISADQQERIWDSFRRWGYLQANLDPLGDLAPVPMLELDVAGPKPMPPAAFIAARLARRDRKSTRLNSSHPSISYAVFCLKKKNIPIIYFSSFLT